MPDAESRQPEAESRKPKAGSRRPAAGSRQPEAGSRELVTRRSLFARVATAAGLAAVAGQAAALIRSFVPNVSYDPPTRVKVGRPESFADGFTFLADRRVFIAREAKTFRAVSAVCTHLGCTVRVESADRSDPTDPTGRREVQVHQFSCPCHGSRYGADGANLSGPAPRPLAAFALTLAPDDGQLVLDLGREVAPTATLTVP